MPELPLYTDYKGLETVNTDRAADAGTEKLTDNFMQLADRAPFRTSTDPGAGDDSTLGFAPGDQWLNTTSEVTWVCVDATEGSAVWKSFFHRSATALTLAPEGPDSEFVEVPRQLRITGDRNSTALLVSTDGGSVARFENTGGSMQIFVDADATDQRFASVELRDRTAAGDNRTRFIRTFSGHNNWPDHLLIRHHVDGSIRLRMAISEDGNFGVGLETPKARLHGTGSTILGAASNDVNNSDMGNGQLNIWVDEATDELNFKVRYSNGTVKSGSVALT